MKNIEYLEISPTNLESLKEQATDWALSHGLVVRSNSNHSSTTVHAPISLFPSPFPKKEFDINYVSPEYKTKELIIQFWQIPNFSYLISDNKEISVAYFRSGYSPKDYPTEKEWAARLLIERSKAIKCPTVAYQLVGVKKMQQVLAVPGVLENPEGEAAAKLALEHPERFVMKPQREGGDIPQLLRNITPLERSSYILMDLIQPPMMKNIIIREGKVIQGEMISELGIYGVFIGGNNGDEDVVVNEIGGHLLRTKGRETNEGGVATGYSVIDSPLLI
ncbi:5893_t:CDS:2 [Racocetra fulgida]|uniref:5893_t:CDS:1 n=1 Tax=Racocetra fulgida TaxID=60492 RepID=A0A9N8ZHC6_9GLOM|nr:5893_t:CDS:2 [Racocetra fulgida]